MEACHVGGFDDFGECDKFGKILSKCEMHTKGTNKVANLTNTANLVNMANRPFYSCVLSDLALDWKRGWR